MTERRDRDDQVDRYVRGELSETEAAEFELSLLEDPGLQDELESALGIRSALEWESGSESDVGDRRSRSLPSQWAPYAMAASVVLAVVSTTLYWRASIHVSDLEGQLDSLRGPLTSVLNVPVDIMRSAGQAPGVIVQKPSEGLVVLDIEISGAFRDIDVVHFTLRPESGGEGITWSAKPGGSRRTTVALQAATIPDGLFELTIEGEAGQLKETRLMEFRPAGDH